MINDRHNAIIGSSPAEKIKTPDIIGGMVGDEADGGNVTSDQGVKMEQKENNDTACDEIAGDLGEPTYDEENEVDANDEEIII